MSREVKRTTASTMEDVVEDVVVAVVEDVDVGEAEAVAVGLVAAVAMTGTPAAEAVVVPVPVQVWGRAKGWARSLFISSLDKCSSSSADSNLRVIVNVTLN